MKTPEQMTPPPVEHEPVGYRCRLSLPEADGLPRTVGEWWYASYRPGGHEGLEIQPLYTAPPQAGRANAELPKLPEPFVAGNIFGAEFLFTADQMRAYGIAARATQEPKP